MKLDRLTVLLLAAALLAAAGVGLGIARMHAEAMAAADSVAHTLEVRATIGRLESALRAVESALRGFVVIGDEQLLQQDRISAEAPLAVLARIKALTADNAEQRQRLERLTTETEAYLDHAANIVRLRREQGFAVAAAAIGDGDGRRLVDRAVSWIAAVADTEDRLLAERRQRLAARQLAARTATALGAAATFILLALVVLRLQRENRLRRSAEANLRAVNASQEAVITARTGELLTEIARQVSLIDELERLRSIIDNTSDLIAMADADERITYINRPGRQMLGLTADEPLTGMTPARFHPPWALAVLRGQGFPAAIAHGRWLGETALLASDGREIAVSQVVIAHRDGLGRLKFFSTIARDISALKQVQAELEGSRDAFRQIALMASDYFWEQDAELRFRHVSPSILQRAGIDYEAMIGKRPWEIAQARVDAARWAAHRHLLDARLPFRNLEMEMATGDGGTRWLLVSGDPVFGGDGRFEGYRGVSADITDRRLAEDRLRDYAERLRQLSRELLRVQEEERAALSRELHDEVGQQLAALKLNLKALAKQAGAEQKARLADCLDVVETTIAQIRDRALDLRPSLLDDLGLAAALEWHCRRQGERTGVAVVFVAGALPAKPDADVATAAYRVAQEAINNALKHGRPRRIDVGLSMGEETLTVTVADDGGGFDPAAVAGRGLGLAGMRERAAILGGNVAVQSAPGHGARVRAEFPLTNRHG